MPSCLQVLQTTWHAESHPIHRKVPVIPNGFQHIWSPIPIGWGLHLASPPATNQLLLYQAGGKAILHPQYKRTYSSISQQRQGSMLGCSTPRLSVCHRLDAPEDAHINKGMQFGRGKFDILQQQVLPADQYLKPCILVSDAGISIHWLISWNPATRFAGMKHGSIGKMGHISSTCPLKNQQRPWFLQLNGPHKRQVRIFHTLCSSERTCQWLPYHV